MSTTQLELPLTDQEADCARLKTLEARLEALLAELAYAPSRDPRWAELERLDREWVALKEAGNETVSDGG